MDSIEEKNKLFIECGVTNDVFNLINSCCYCEFKITI